MMDIELSRAYYLSHILLRNNVFFNWEEFNNHLKLGPDLMKEELVKMWNSIDDKAFKNEVTIKDKNRVVTVDDFDIVLKKIVGIPVFIFKFPEPQIYDLQAEAVALALCKKEPRYITMEIWSPEEEDKHYTVAEWIVEHRDFMHRNYGKLRENDIREFERYVERLLRYNS